MQIISGARQSGKTTKLIELAHNKPIYIVCADRNRCLQLKDFATRQGKNILMPVTISELKKMVGYHPSIDFLVDELGHCFQLLFPDKKFLVANLTTENEYSKGDYSELVATNEHLGTEIASRNKIIASLKNEMACLLMGVSE